MEPSQGQGLSYAHPSSTDKPPLSERINVRMIIFAVVVLFLLGWPIYIFVNASITHGIYNHGSYKEVDLKAMGNFEFDPIGGSLKDVPPQYRALDGQKVQLEGEIYDPNEAGDITHWQLVYSIQRCCFNGPPRVQERVFCSAKRKGQSFPRGDGYHRVTGTLHVAIKQQKNPDGTLGPVQEVYHLDAEKVEPL
jgi:hypothetical protein